MIGVIAVLKVQPDKTSPFEAVFASLAEKVRANEPGNLMYQLTRARSEPGVYKDLEIYRDQDALTHHGQTDHDGGRGRDETGYGRKEYGQLPIVRDQRRLGPGQHRGPRPGQGHR